MTLPLPEQPTPPKAEETADQPLSRTEAIANEVSDTGRTVIYAIMIALCIRMFAFEPFSIPSSSMVPNLLVGDYLFVSKYSYGFSSLSSFMGVLPIPGRFFGSEPQRGDVIVFKLPRDSSTDYIKRLVGLPGDQIQVRHGILFVNGAPMPREKLAAPIEQEYIEPDPQVNDYLETFPNGQKHVIRKNGDTNSLDDTEVFTVPADHYFMMGDNRDNSLDSRTTNVGFVPRDNLVGRAEFLFFSLENRPSPAHSFWSLPNLVRWNRLFMKIT